MFTWFSWNLRSLHFSFLYFCMNFATVSWIFAMSQLCIEFYMELRVGTDPTYSFEVIYIFHLVSFFVCLFLCFSNSLRSGVSFCKFHHLFYFKSLKTEYSCRYIRTVYKVPKRLYFKLWCCCSVRLPVDQIIILPGFSLSSVLFVNLANLSSWKFVHRLKNKGPSKNSVTKWGYWK